MNNQRNNKIIIRIHKIFKNGNNRVLIILQCNAVPKINSKLVLKSIFAMVDFLIENCLLDMVLHYNIINMIIYI
jgi:hypothetical protein